MPSAAVTSTTPSRILKGRSRKGCMLQNNNSFSVWVRWDGNKNVTGNISDNENCGIRIGIGGTLSITEGVIPRSNDYEIWAIAEGGATVNTGYINFIEI